VPPLPTATMLRPSDAMEETTAGIQLGDLVHATPPEFAQRFCTVYIMNAGAE
jgi:hypothetical protein